MLMFKGASYFSLALGPSKLRTGPERSCCFRSSDDQEPKLSRISSSSVIWVCEACRSSNKPSVSLRCPWIELLKLDSLLNWDNPSARCSAFSLQANLIRMRGILTRTKENEEALAYRMRRRTRADVGGGTPLRMLSCPA